MRKINPWLFFLAALALFALVLYLVLLPGRPAEREFRVSPGTEIGRVVMSPPEGESLVLQRGPGGEWLLSDHYLANEAALRELFSALRFMEVRRPVPMAGRQEVAAGLQRRGVLVEVYSRGYWLGLPGRQGILPRYRKERAFWVGENTADGLATHMQLRDAATPFEVHVPGAHGGLQGVFVTDKHLWRDPVIIDLGPDQLQKIRAGFAATPAQSYRIMRSGQEFLLFDRDGLQLDPAGISMVHLGRFLNSFTGLYYERLIPGSATQPPADLIGEVPFLRLWVEDTAGSERLLKFYLRRATADGSLVSAYRKYDPNRFYLQLDHGDFALAQYYVFQRIMRPLSYFLQNNDQ